MLLFYLLTVWIIDQYPGILGRYSQLYILGSTGLLAIYWFRNKTNRFFQKDIMIMCFLIMWILLNTFTIGDAGRGLNKLLPFITGFFIPYFLIVAHYENIHEARQMFKVWTVIGILDGILSICQVSLGDAFYFLQYRLSPDVDVVKIQLLESGHYSGLGFFRSRAANATFLMIPLLYLFNKISTIKFNTTKVIIILLSIMVLILGVISSNSRTHIVILCLNFLIIFSLNYFISRSQSLWKYLWVLILFVSILLSLYFYVGRTQYMIGGLLGRFDLLEYDYYHGRRMFWEVSLAQLRTVGDYISGIGFGVTGNTSKLYEVHNGYIELLVELGIIGCLLWGLFCFIILKKAYKSLDHLKSQQTYLSEYTIILIMFINGLIGRIGGGGFIDSDIILAISAGMITVHYAWILEQQSVSINTYEELKLKHV